MSFTFIPNEMSDDLVALSRAASPFFSAQSVHTIERLAADLTNAVANCKHTGQTQFQWKTTAPIKIRESRQYKGGTEDFSPLSAELTVEYTCTRRDADERLYAEGVTVMRIKDPDKEEEKVLHFDAEKGGWTEMHEGKERIRSGHPAFHMQFYGLINDIPRVPSLIVHPIDVLTWAILELHQKKWRDHVMSVSNKSKLRLIPKRQRCRFDCILQAWRQTIAKPDYLAIVAMQTKVSEPLLL